MIIRRNLGAVPVEQFCSAASWYNPLAYLFCLPSDVRKVYNTAANAVVYGSDYKLPPAAAPPGAPQTFEQMTVESGTPGGYSIEESAADSMAATRANWQDFFTAQAADTPVDDPCAHWYSMFKAGCPVNTQGLLIAVLGGGLLAAIALPSGGRRRRR